MNGFIIIFEAQGGGAAERRPPNWDVGNNAFWHLNHEKVLVFVGSGDFGAAGSGREGDYRGSGHIFWPYLLARSSEEEF